MTAPEVLRARLALAVEALAGAVQRRAREGGPLAAWVILAVGPEHPLASTLAGDGGRVLRDGSVTGLVGHGDARKLVMDLHPDLVVRLDTPVGDLDTWAVAIGAGASLATVAHWHDLAKHAEARA